jgi:exo-beta-1,3-glucanase (GH17 family)
LQVPTAKHLSQPINTFTKEHGRRSSGIQHRQIDKEGWGFTYSPYKASGTCKTSEDILRDLKVATRSYSLIRIYGTSCNQVTNVIAAAQKYNLRIFAGIFDINRLEQEARIIIDAFQGNWERLETVAIGNELVNAAPDHEKNDMAIKVVEAIRKSRQLFTKAGYRGKIVTVDTWVAARAYPSLCKASDFCAVNIHPFFDGNVAANGAGKSSSLQLQTC